MKIDGFHALSLPKWPSDGFSGQKEDAQAAVAHGADGIIVSNHGGRNEETLRATIDCVAEVVAAVKGRVPVLMDGSMGSSSATSSRPHSISQWFDPSGM